MIMSNEEMSTRFSSYNNIDVCIQNWVQLKWAHRVGLRGKGSEAVLLTSVFKDYCRLVGSIANKLGPVVIVIVNIIAFQKN